MLKYVQSFTFVISFSLYKHEIVYSRPYVDSVSVFSVSFFGFQAIRYCSVG